MKPVLRLYVTGRSVHAARAIEQVRGMAEERLGGGCELEIVDLLRNPELAAEDAVLATPALVRRRPEPRRKIVGDLDDTERVLAALEMAATAPAPARGGAGAGSDGC